LSAAPAYVAFGPVFETRSKASPEPVVGVTLLRAAAARASAAGVPLVAIGGITRERARELLGAADAVAVIADLVPAVIGADPMREVTARARALHALFGSEPLAAGLAP
jgi:thiamine-phosphate pyrophosphorylase